MPESLFPNTAQCFVKDHKFQVFFFLKCLSNFLSKSKTKLSWTAKEIFGISLNACVRLNCILSVGQIFFAEIQILRHSTVDHFSFNYMYFLIWACVDSACSLLMHRASVLSCNYILYLYFWLIQASSHPSTYDWSLH